jgi:pimeloyl-ACP methyl ester carboxylesterase
MIVDAAAHAATSRSGTIRAAEGAVQPDRFGKAYGISLGTFHKIAFADWGNPEIPPSVICLHGLTRQGRDFDFLASALARENHRVICPDLPGRGRSDRLPTAFHYTFVQHCADALAVLNATGARSVDWVGTSIGGLIGLVLAGLPNSRIRRLVINDIGPEVPAVAVSDVCRKLATLPLEFQSFNVALQYFRDNFRDYGDLDDHHWEHITRHSIEQIEGGASYRMLLDKDISFAFNMFHHFSFPIWSLWRNIEVPVLLITGENSSFVPPELAEKMIKANENARLLSIPRVGHMPMLMEHEQIDPIVSFLAN